MKSHVENGFKEPLISFVPSIGISELIIVPNDFSPSWGNSVFVTSLNGKSIYRKIFINDGIVTIEDYSEDVDLEEYTTWGEEKEGIKVKFSEGYKRLS